MSRRNSRFQKAIRREQRQADKERAAFIHETSQQAPIGEQSLRFVPRRERRGGR